MNLQPFVVRMPPIGSFYAREHSLHPSYSCKTEPAMKKLSILIVDDAPDVCSLLSHWLRAHHTACVHCGADALTALSLLHFDLVITDIHMPDVSGLDVIRKVKQSQPWVKVLAI